MRQQLSEFKADFFKALAHPLRISILDALRDGELTVNEISQRFDVEQANARRNNLLYCATEISSSRVKKAQTSITP